MKKYINGIGSIMVIAPSRRKPTGITRRLFKPAPSAAEALRGDWEKVGNTIREVTLKRYYLNAKKEK